MGLEFRMSQFLPIVSIVVPFSGQFYIKDAKR